MLQEEGTVDADGNIVARRRGTGVQGLHRRGPCGYYTYLQGTSMASPHAAGVAALAVSRYGKRDTRPRRPDAAPRTWRSRGRRRHASTPARCRRCRATRTRAATPTFDALCEGTPTFNGFYGYGIIDAARTVGAPLTTWVPAAAAPVGGVRRRDRRIPASHPARRGSGTVLVLVEVLVRAFSR